MKRSWRRLPYFLTFMPEYANANGYSIFTHSWTVGVELKFYLLFPPIVFLMIKDANWRFAVTAVMAALLTAVGSFNAQSYCAILFGVMLAFALERPRGYAVIASADPGSCRRSSRLCRRAVRHASLHRAAYRGGRWSRPTWSPTAIVQQGALLRILAWPPLVYLGQRSYGAYLLHFLAIRIGYLVFGNDTAIGGLLTACFCLAVTVPAAELMYRAIEGPADGIRPPAVAEAGPGRRR